MTTQPPGAEQASPGLVHIEGLTKRYRSVAALQDFTLTLGAGHIVGLMGPNGCGKTTLLKILAGVLSDYEGSVTIDGHHPGPVSKSIISYLPDVDFLNPDWTARTAIKERSRQSAADFEANNDPRTIALFEELRAWRSQIAKERSRPAYTVFADATLRDIAVVKPTSLPQLSLIRGVGATKLQDYGGPVLALLRDFEAGD